MSATHPIIAVTGSSGAGTTSVMRTFEQIFRRERVTAAFIEGDSFHRYDRAAMKQKMAEALARGDHQLQPLRPGRQSVRGARRLVQELRRERARPAAQVSARRAGSGAATAQQPGTFTEWEELPEDTELLFYEGLHGAVACGEVDVARHVDLLIGVVPVINLEWIQKLHRDRSRRAAIPPKR